MLARSRYEPLPIDPDQPPSSPPSARPLAKESRRALGVIVFFSGIMRPVFSGELSLRVDEVCKH